MTQICENCGSDVEITDGPMLCLACGHLNPPRRKPGPGDPEFG